MLLSSLKNVLGSGIRDQEKTYPGSQIQGSKRHLDPGSATLLSSSLRLGKLRKGDCYLREYRTFKVFFCIFNKTIRFNADA
jgi:hypothetical protein